MKIVSVYIFILCVIFESLAGCKKDDTISNPPPQDTTYGKRNYTFTIDSLEYPGSFQTDMTSMWASSATNIYVVGHNDQNKGLMYHYDGVRWTPVRLTRSDGGNIKGSIDLTNIYGLSPNDIWAVGERIFLNPKPPPNFLDSSLIIHYDGSQWKAYPSMVGSIIYSIWASSATNVWAGGENGAMLHYDGIQWSKYDMGNNFLYSSIRGISGDKIFCIGSNNPSTDYYLFEYNGTVWNIKDSVVNTMNSTIYKFGAGLWSNNKEIYSTGTGVFYRENDQWKRILTAPVLNMFKSSDKNIFAVGFVVYHYNGADWKEFLQLKAKQGFPWLDCFTDGNEVFIVGSNGFKTKIIHGR